MRIHWDTFQTLEDKECQPEAETVGIILEKVVSESTALRSDRRSIRILAESIGWILSIRRLYQIKALSETP